MSVYKRGDLFHYAFTVRGNRYRGSTLEKTLAKAKAFEAILMAKIIEEGPGPRIKKAPSLGAFMPRFEEHIAKLTAADQLDPDTQYSYRYGCKLLAASKAADLKIDQITTSAAGELRFTGGPSNVNKALRTLRRILSYACEVGLLRAAPKIKLLEEQGRDRVIEPWLEDLLLEFAPPVLAATITIMLGSGMRVEEVMRMRWENVLWDERKVFNPFGKSRRARRHVILSDRMRAVLSGIQADQAKDKLGPSEWVFPARGSKSGLASASGHRVNVNKAWTQTMKRVVAVMKERGIKGDVDGIVLYSCRHTFATTFLAAGGELSKLCMLMGHSSIVVTQKYLHPSMVGAADLMNSIDRNKAGLRLVKRA